MVYMKRWLTISSPAAVASVAKPLELAAGKEDALGKAMTSDWSTRASSIRAGEGVRDASRFWPIVGAAETAGPSEAFALALAAFWAGDNPMREGG